MCRTQKGHPVYVPCAVLRAPAHFGCPGRGCMATVAAAGLPRGHRTCHSRTQTSCGFQRRIRGSRAQESHYVRTSHNTTSSRSRAHFGCPRHNIGEGSRQPGGAAGDRHTPAIHEGRSCYSSASAASKDRKCIMYIPGLARRAGADFGCPMRAV